MKTDQPHTILILGAGFAGIRCALDLAKKQKSRAKIVLVSTYDYFEYYPAMYRVATGSSPMEACLRLDMIFRGYDVDVVEDTIVSIDPKAKTAVGESGSTYRGDTLVLALGSEINYFKIKGAEELSFAFKSINQALRLRRRIIELFEKHHKSPIDEALVSFHFVIVGAGPSGVELAGELALFTQQLGKQFNVPESLITIDLVDAKDRVLAKFEPKISARVHKRLRALGVNIYLNRRVIAEESWSLLMNDMQMGTKTVIWTAGVKTNRLYETLEGVFTFDARGRVVVDEHLRAEGFPDVYIAGDNASTEHSGLAQTAIYDGKYIAKQIDNELRGNAMDTYAPKTIGYDVPVGPGWAVITMHGITLYGWLPWFMRHLIDLRFYWSILPPLRALREFFLGHSHKRIPEH